MVAPECTTGLYISLHRCNKRKGTFAMQTYHHFEALESSHMPHVNVNSHARGRLALHRRNQVQTLERVGAEQIF